MTTAIGSSTAGSVRFPRVGEGQVAIPGVGLAGLIMLATNDDASATLDQARAAIVAAVQQHAADLVLTYGHEASPERIAVTLVEVGGQGFLAARGGGEGG